MTTIAAPENRLTARAAVGRACRMVRANRPRAGIEDGAGQCEGEPEDADL